MVTSNLLPSHIGVRVGENVFDAVPVLLRGDEAAVVMEHVPHASGAVALIVDWSDGRVTELAARVRHVDRDSRVHMDVLCVEGDWRPFLEYLGSSRR